VASYQYWLKNNSPTRSNSPLSIFTDVHLLIFAQRGYCYCFVSGFRWKMCNEPSRTAAMKPYVLLFLIFLAFDSRSQSAAGSGAATGSVADSATGKPIAFATASLYRLGKLLNGTFTDSSGRFELKGLPFGIYYLEFSAVGYRNLQTRRWEINHTDSVARIGKVVMQVEARNLNTVTIRGQKPLIEQRADGIHFNVESLPAIAGGDASDVLRKVPMLSVDASGGLAMRGSSNIRVFIDGKPSDTYASSIADALKSIQGESIIRVEVITHPSARYDAEGTDGVVNIITRRVRENITNGTISGLLASRSANGMGSLQSKTGKWLFKADAFYQPYRNRNGSVLRRDAGDFHLLQKNETRETGLFAVGGVHALYSLDSLNTLNVGYRMRSAPNRTNLISENFNEEDGTLLPSFQRQVRTPFTNNGKIFTAGYTGTSKDKMREFSLLGTYFLAKSTNDYDLIQTNGQAETDRENFRGKTRNQDLIVQMDYVQAFGTNLKWEAGGKLTQKKLDSDNRFGIYQEGLNQYLHDPVRSNYFSYLSSVYALYTSFNFQIRKWQFITGLRYEYTHFDADFKKSPLTIPTVRNWVPNFLISKNLGTKGTMKLGYTVKLMRPYFTYLNPTVNNTDSLHIQFGNPYLRPELTRRYQLSYSKNARHLFTDIALFYNLNRNSIETIRTPRADGVFENTWKNIGRNKRLGISTTLNWKPGTKSSLSATVTIEHVELKSPALELSNSGLMRQLVLNFSQKLPKGYSVDFYGFFAAASIRLQGYREGWKYYTLTFNKKSGNERFNTSVRLETFLKPHVFIDEVTQNDTFFQIQTSRYQMQNVRLSVSYKLGKKEIKSPHVRQRDAED
jgi:5-hydroxyisourate hydrolase-like protein (transthyretin family)